jgi:hypothetical protein
MTRRPDVRNKGRKSPRRRLRRQVVTPGALQARRSVEAPLRIRTYRRLCAVRWCSIAERYVRRSRDVSGLFANVGQLSL